jgi:hypothetical protein
MVTFLWVSLGIIVFIIAFSIFMSVKYGCDHEYGPWSDEQTHKRFIPFDYNHQYDGDPGYDYFVVTKFRSRFCEKCGNVHKSILDESQERA